MIYFFVFLLRLVAYLEGNVKIVSFLGIFTLISYSTLKRVESSKLLKLSKYGFIIMSIIVLVVAHGLLFGNLLTRDIAVLITYWMWFVFTMAYFKKNELNKSLHYILIAFTIYNLANYIFFEMYFDGQKLGYNSIMKLFGIKGYRIYFPLSSGANVYTFQVGINALLSLFFIRTKKSKIPYISIYSFHIFILILADSRLILLFTLFFSFLYWFSVESILKILRKNWLLIITFIILLIFIFYGTSLFDSIKRPGERTGNVLTRVQIWVYALEVAFDDLNIIFGHGFNGLESNISDDIKESFGDQHLQTSHNFYLQNLVDFGIVGLTIILYLLFKIVQMTIRLKVRILTIILVMFLLIGATESIPTIYSFDATIFFIAVLALIITQYERKVIRSN